MSDARLTLGSHPTCDLVLDDPTVAPFHAEIGRSRRGIEVVDLGSTGGIVVNGLRLVRGAVSPGTTLELGRVEVSVDDAGLGEVELTRELPDMVAVAQSTRATLARVERASTNDLSVLISGESGTGKERFAEAIHRLGPRATRPFVVVDCGAIPPSLLASELFGHEKGAFTGARDPRAGAFERAGAGTVFLDEIAELTSEAAMLLSGTLARRTFRRLGGSRDLSLEARVVAASHQDLRRLVNDGRFREDLFRRIAEVRVDVAPLRERPEEILPLIDRFLREAGESRGATDVFTAERLDALQSHRWPGNVRELRQVVLSELYTGEPAELIAPAPTGPFGAALHLPFREARDQCLEHFESVYLTQLLERTRHNVAEGARVAGIDRTHLHDLLRRHGLR